MLLNWKEINSQFRASVRILLGQRQAIAELDLSVSGFWYSFVAVALALPFAVTASIFDFHSSLEKKVIDASASVVGFVFVHQLVSLVSYLVSLVVVYTMARSIKVEAGFPASVIVFNWGGLAMSIVSFPLIVLMNLMTRNETSRILPFFDLAVIGFMVAFAFAVFNTIRLTFQLTNAAAVLFVFVVYVFEVTTYFALLGLIGY